jgi:thioredoxin-related protein
VLSQRYINDYVRENFRIVQLDLWGSREVTDFDGARLTEKALAERWGVTFTPTIVIFQR